MRLRSNQLATLTIVCVASALLLVAAGGGGATRLHLRAPASSWEGLVGGPRPQVALGQRMVVVLRAPSLSTGGSTKAALASQQRLLDRLTASGVGVRPEFRYTRVLNGFSAPLDGAALSLLEADKAVAGVYAVRAAYPAALSSSPRDGRTEAPAWGGASLPGFDGRGVTIALLDTGIDLSHPWLHGRIKGGIDFVDGSAGAEAHSRPGDPSEVEEHGTESASLLVGTAADLAGVAPAATVLALRVAGWQRDANGSWAVFARTDQVLAGLERAVDPNRDGNASDAARIALVPLAEPFAAFPDEPLARAAAGAARLGTLVVAAAGNDGPAAAVFGSISAPGAAAAALTVGAADLRARARETRVVLRTGLEVLLDRALPLAGAVGPSGRVQLPIVRVASRPGSVPALSDFFDGGGYSRVAGRAALLPGGGSVELTVERAARAGAKAVLLYGPGPPPGALGAAQSLSVPVVTLPTQIGAPVADAVGRGTRIFVTVGPTRVVENASSGRVASFSSRGLAFDGRLKPDLVAPGVGLVAAEPGFADDGTPRFGTMNGSSAAAALVAGAAALLVQARPELDPAALKSLLIGSAHPVPDDPVGAQGAGLLDVGVASAREVESFPPTLALGPISRAGSVQGTFALRNVSTRALTLYVSAGPQGPRRPASLQVTPSRIELPPGRSARVRVRARVRQPPDSFGMLQGSLRVTPVGVETPVRIPWTIGTRPATLPLLTGLRLSAHRFAPSDSSPAVLAFQAGRLLSGEGGASVQPVSRLDIELFDRTEARTARLGLLARLRDLLPGRYAFGLTGRDPHGKILPPGDYELRLAAFPTLRGPATRRSVTFTVLKS